MILPIVQYDDPRLRQKGATITVFDHTLSELAQNMLETMYSAKGIGLAAQQIGQAIMLCVIDVQQKANELDFEYTLDEKTPPIDLMMPLVLVNPILKLSKGEKVWYDEGCLSFPGIRAEIQRPDTLSVKYQDLTGASHTIVCNGLLSRVIQHETDHLNGILFIDRMPKSAVKKLWNDLEALKANRTA